MLTNVLLSGSMPIEVVVDVPSTIMVAVALVFTLAACFFAVRFSRSIGGELGAAFKFVVAGFIIFAISRIDDMLKVSGTWAKAGIDYKHVLWVPHSAVVVLAWALITFGCYRMWRTFQV
jgi:hypothetical protein